jgi:uncharacterized protein YbcI
VAGFASDTAQRPDANHRGDMLLGISNAVVGLYKQHFGKGPTKARTYADGNVITCILQDGLTAAERTLLQSGHRETVVQGRHMLQESARDEFVAAVEEITGRTVVAFISGTQVEPDMAAEVFVLDGDTAPGRPQQSA